MTDKQNLIIMLTNAALDFKVEGNKVSFSTSANGDLTTMYFDSEDKLKNATCNC